MLVRLRKFVQGSEGTIMVMAALGLVAFLGLASLAIDMGHRCVVRNELQNVADAAALAGARQLISNQNGTAVVDSGAAQTAVMSLAQTQAQLSGLPTVPDGSRNDISVAFGNWNIYAGSPTTAWTDTDGSAGSNSNAVRVSIQRASGLAYGPVTNFLAGILGLPTSSISASATAYLGFAYGTSPGGVDLPVAIPDTAITAANPQSRPWYARVLGPSEAVASGPTTLIFQDLGSGTRFTSNNTNLYQPLFDTQKGYMVIVNSSDAVPDTVNNNLVRQYNHTSGTPVRKMKRGDRLYPLSEYQWYSNNKTIFSNFKQAYNAKKDSNGKYKAVVPVYSSTNPLTSRLEQGWKMLASLFSFGPSPAYACFTFWTQGYQGGNVPIYVEGFTSVNVTNVSYNSSCDDCSNYNPAKDGQRYSSSLDCLIHSAGSCNNQNTITVEVPGGSTVSNPGTTSGGPDNNHINPTASHNVGTFASEVKLVK